MKFRHLCKSLFIFVLAYWPAFSISQTALDLLVQDFLAKAFATSALMSDDEVIKFGIWDFNPNDVVNLEDENLGSEQSTKIRQSLRQFSIPFHWRLSDEDRADTVSLMAKAAYIDQEQSLQLVPSNESRTDNIYEQVLSAGVGLRYLKTLDDNWELVLEGYLTWMRYSNEVDFNTTESRLFEPFFNGLFTNIDTELLMAEPAVGLNYNWSRQVMHYQLFTKQHYLKGRTLNADIEAHDARTEAWYLTNGFALKRSFLMEDWSKHALWFRLARTDMGGDLKGAIGENHYYEAGVAWLVDTHRNNSFFENFGVGININYGSELSGGTIIFLYNFDGFR